MFVISIFTVITISTLMLHDNYKSTNTLTWFANECYLFHVLMEAATKAAIPKTVLERDNTCSPTK